MVAQWLECWLSTLETVSFVGRGSSVVGVLALNIRDCVSFVGRGSSVVGALALNIRDCVSLVVRGSSVVGAPLQNLGKFVYPTSTEETLKAIGLSMWCLYQGREIQDLTQGVNV